MAYKQITEKGKSFIRQVCGQSTDLFTGKNGILPYSNMTTDVLWQAKPSYKPSDTSDNVSNITTNAQLAEALIILFDRYAKKYDLDANIIAAQAYAESRYRLWAYPSSDSTASGINQFTMITVYDVIVNNNTPITPKFTVNEIATITAGLTNPTSQAAYEVDRGTPETIAIAKANRTILHQNIMNNPEIMIKAQCRYMKYFANSCKNLASTSLFCYSRGGAYAADTYSKAIEKAKGNKRKDYEVEGLNYVLKIFGILGDANNSLGLSGYKPKGYYFGYDDLGMNKYPNPDFNAYDANITESDEYNISTTDLGDLPSLSNLPNYKYIYFPESQYNRDKTPKNQIVLHHTVSGPSVNGDVYSWEAKGDKVATSFLISREGIIYQTFSTDYWAWHLGVTGSSNTTLNQHSIGIELDSWGGLVQSGGKWYPASYVGKTEPISDVIEYNAGRGYPNGYRGYYGFERYTQAQLDALKQLILIIQRDKWNDIPLVYQESMWDNYSNNSSAMKGVSGIWGHINYRPDKSDPHPQPELIETLQSLV